MILSMGGGGEGWRQPLTPLYAVPASYYLAALGPKAVSEFLRSATNHRAQGFNRGQSYPYWHLPCPVLLRVKGPYLNLGACRTA